MAELALLIMLFLESDIFLTEDCDVDDVIILSFDDKEFDIWDSCPESFLFSDDPDGIGISKDIGKRSKSTLNDQHLLMTKSYIL